MKSLFKMFPFVKPYRYQAVLALLLLVGMVASDRDGTLGVDIEEYEPQRPGIESHILTEA